MAKNKSKRKMKAKTTTGSREKGESKVKNGSGPRPKAAGITPEQYENLLVGIRSLHERLDVLQAKWNEMRPLGSLEGAAPVAAGDGGMVSLTFKKTTGPDNLRVTLMDTNEPVLLPFSKKGTSEPREVGANISAKVEVNGGAAVVIDVTHASPGQLNGRGEFPITVLE